MANLKGMGIGYHRYHIDSQPVDDIKPWPTRFKVQVGKWGLAKHLISDVFHSRGKTQYILSQPCIYGTFSGTLGGFMPRLQYCVGCLRCMNEHPEFVRISPNPDRTRLGDSFFTSKHIDAIAYEAQSGMVPVKGGGYGGKFGGEGWDGMWTDMSEIVRPTRDGIHGREFISTMVDIGYKPNFLVFDSSGRSVGEEPRTLSIQLPMFFDIPPASDGGELLWRIVAQVASEIETLTVIPITAVVKLNINGAHVVPLVSKNDKIWLDKLAFTPRMIEMQGWDEKLYSELMSRFSESLITLRTEFTDTEALLSYAERGVHVFHLFADYHGRGRNGKFIIEMVNEAHSIFVQEGMRDLVTLLGSGGIIAAEHLPKAIIHGLDAIALDTPVLVALQAEFGGECANRETSWFRLPSNMSLNWGVQRLKNMMASWRDQMLEILGAMGIRDVRRLRGELGRAMFMRELEAEAFAGIHGYERQNNS